MLPFMREQGAKDSAIQSFAATSADFVKEPDSNKGSQQEKGRLGTTEKTLQKKPFEAGGEKQQDKLPKSQGQSQAESQEYLTVAAHSQNVRKTTMLLAILFVAGLLSLWLMIAKSTPGVSAAASMNLEETNIDRAIVKITGIKSEMFNRMDEIVKKFYEFSDVQQVKVSELVKNPFKLEMLLANYKKNTDEEELGIDIELLRREQAKKMQLLSIMQSEQGNCCMIDDKILYEGDKIRGFEVRQISNTFVKIVPLDSGAGPQADDLELILKLSE